jgi:CheY-like chemotaxis protein/nitrogen-specific signal transduction histidine kinase
MVLVSGGVLFWYIISRINRQNQLIQRLDASEKKVREVSLVKENFMANMSHEIRTPLNAILGFTNLIKARNKDPELAEFVGTISSSGQNLLDIVNDILDLSKIEAGMMRIESSPFSIRELLHSVQTMFMEKITQKGLDLTVSIDEIVPDTLSGDATRLTQILVNMIGNAIKFTDRGLIQITVTGRGMEESHIRLGFEIRDTGIGIAKDKLPGIFDRFRQAEDSITRKYGGTGLGLSIVKQLVLLQHGEIEVRSEPGTGTTFQFTIPYKIAAGRLSDPRSTEFSGPRLAGAENIRILVVEDNKMNQSLLRHLLSGWDLSFEMVSNGIEAIEKLRNNRYDLVLMDVQMPGMDGYTATQEIRMKLKLDIPIIAMTAHAFSGEREKSLSYGMNEYIAKPLSEKELFRLINQFAGLKREPAEQKKQENKTTTPVYHTINLQYMREISEGDKEYERTVTEQFIEVVPAEIETLESALTNKDQALLRRTAHNMRSDIAIMGLLEKLQPYLDALEYEDFDEPKFQQAITTIKSICSKALPEARDFYDRL